MQRIVFTLLLLIAPFAAVAATIAIADGPPPVTAVPGSIVRWPGAGLADCWIGARHWPPYDGACWYPVDLEAQGELELARRSSGGVASRKLRVGSYPYPTQRLEVEEKYVSPPAAELARIEREKAAVARLFALETPRRFQLPLGAPLAALPGSSRFGARRIFNGESRSPHSGADFSATSGTPVLAPADGVVALADEQFFAGRAVYLDHGDGLISMSFHLSEIAVRTGDIVAKGALLGKVGATGRVTGPHLHFALRWHGARVDPALLLNPVDLLEIH